MKFLIVKSSSIGDIIQTFPVLEYLHQKYPEAGIDWVVENEYRELIAAHPLVRSAIPFHSRRWRKELFPALREIPSFARVLRQEMYDVLFDLQGNTKSAFVTMLARATVKVGLDWKSVPEFPSFFSVKRHITIDRTLPMQRRYLQVVQKFFDDEEDFSPLGISLTLTPEEKSRLASLRVLGHFRIMVACGSRWANKRLAAQTLVDILRKVGQEGDPYYYFIGGNQEEIAEAERLQSLFPQQSQVVDGLTLPLWQALMREVDLVIAVDSAALALCGTTSTPSISFFGPSLARIYKPLGNHHIAWQGICPYGQQFDARCPKLRTCKTGACLKLPSAEELLKGYSSRLIKRK